MAHTRSTIKINKRIRFGFDRVCLNNYNRQLKRALLYRRGKVSAHNIALIISLKPTRMSFEIVVLWHCYGVTTILKIQNSCKQKNNTNKNKKKPVFHDALPLQLLT